MRQMGERILRGKSQISQLPKLGSFEELSVGFTPACSSGRWISLAAKSNFLNSMI